MAVGGTNHIKYPLHTPYEHSARPGDLKIESKQRELGEKPPSVGMCPAANFLGWHAHGGRACVRIGARGLALHESASGGVYLFALNWQTRLGTSTKSG